MIWIIRFRKILVCTFAALIVLPFSQITFAQESPEKLSTEVSLAIENTYAPQDVNVTVKGDGWVTLTGTVKSLYDKYSLYEIASRVHGVKRITNDINVVASTTSGNTNADILPDDEIKQNILYSIKMDAAIDQPRNIKVVVDNHLAILSGTVDFYREKLVAETLASQVLGVYAIQNDINVVPINQAFSDSDIKAALESVLRNEFPLENSKNINISVNNGFVTLTGTVSSLWVKDKMEDEFSSIGGVDGVFDQLKVKPDLNS